MSTSNIHISYLYQNSKRTFRNAFYFTFCQPLRNTQFPLKSQTKHIQTGYTSKKVHITLSNSVKSEEELIIMTSQSFTWLKLPSVATPLEACLQWVFPTYPCNIKTTTRNLSWFTFKIEFYSCAAYDLQPHIFLYCTCIYFEYDDQVAFISLMQDHVNIKLVSIILYKKNSRSLEFAWKMNNKK